jgi:glycosyltransferase involved in cell wall biosynthesis
VTTLAEYRNRHTGETIVVCGCGPSLKELATPAARVTIGVNDVGRLFDPAYLVVVNPPSQFAPGRFEYVRGSRAKALFTQLDLGPVAPPVVRFALGQRGGTDDGGGRVLHYTQNSPYVAVGLAAWMGARRIELIGVDFVNDHFFGQTGPHRLAPRLREVDAEYGRLAEALRGRGIELVNLSTQSRLQSLPRVPAKSASPPERKLTVTVQPSRGCLIGQLLDALAESISTLGHQVVRARSGATGRTAALTVVWNGRNLRGNGPVLFCEHGWLPRTDYQISPRGINADSHIAPFLWDGRPLAPDDDALDTCLAQLRNASRGSGAGAELPPEFLLVPLQIESDTNIVRHAPPGLRTMQALVDQVSQLDPPWPVIYKQHPADVRRGQRHMALRLRRRRDRLWSHAQGDVHAMLASGRCVGVLTINSNVAHDALLWDVPPIVLGRNVWPAGDEASPFLTAIPHDWSELRKYAGTPEAIACRRAYAHHLIKNQWTLADARNPQRVAALIDFALRSNHPAAQRPPGQNTTAPISRSASSVINVVCANRGWLFEVWKQRFVAVRHDGCQVLASERPVRAAAAWIFIRTVEAKATPEPRRTLVQLHDLADNGIYRKDGARACVAECAGISLTHPAQKAILEANGFDFGRRHWLLQPVGWQSAQPLDSELARRPVVAWVGRPARRDGREISGLEMFTRAARHWAGLADVVLVGERLDATAADLAGYGVRCRVWSLARYPVICAPQWLSHFDVVVLTSEADAGPWPIFDTLSAGVPVVAPAIGRTEHLLSDRQCGRLVTTVEEMAEAVEELVAHRSEQRARRFLLSKRVAELSFEAWLHRNLQLAVELAKESIGG